MNMLLTAVIIDDEEAGIETLKILISRNQVNIRILATTQSAEEGIAFIESYKPNLVFLDISMPSMDGFELISRLSFHDFKLIFTTAHTQYAIQAIKTRAFDYLVKPIDDSDFRLCIKKIMEEHEKATIKNDPGSFLEIPVKDGIMYLKQRDIVRLEASRSYTYIHMENHVRHVASKTLADFEVKLDSTVFFRCHKSHLVNLQKVIKFVNHNGFYVQMSDGSMPSISKAHKDIFLERLKIV